MKALELKPNDESLNLTLRQILGSLSYDDASPRIMKRIEHAPDNHALHYQMGLLHEKKGNTDNALVHYRKALAAKSDFIPVLNNMGFIYMQRSDYRTAVSFFKKIVEIQPSHASAYYNIACIYALENQKGEALSYFEEALKNGFTNWSHIMSDGDLQNIRGTGGFKRLKEKYSG